MAKPFHVPKGTFHSVSLQNKLTAKLQFILWFDTHLFALRQSTRAKALAQVIGYNKKSARCRADFSIMSARQIFHISSGAFHSY